MIVRGVNRFHRAYVTKMRVRLAISVALFITSSWIYVLEPFGIRQPGLTAPVAGISLIVVLYYSFHVFGKPYCCFHPYFYQRLNENGHNSTYGKGHAIATRLDELDAFSKENDVRPLSSFGFRDSFKNAKVDWHSADDGLCTVEWLLEHAKLHNAEKNELDGIAQSLRVAIESSVQFCFHMDFVDGTNGMEHEQREGSYW